MLSSDEVLEMLKADLGNFLKPFGFSIGINSEMPPDKQGGEIKNVEGNVILKSYFVLTQSEEGVEIYFSPGNITFLKVEKITLPILIKYGHLGSSAKKDPITFIPSNEQEKLAKSMIQDESELSSCLEKFKVYFKEKLLPAYTKYKNLKEVSRLLEDLPQLQISDWIPKGVYKKATIWKLANNPNYNDYIEWLIKGMSKRTEKNPGNADYKRSYDTVSELKMVLDKIDT